jgi:HSP20 family protein
VSGLFDGLPASIRASRFSAFPPVNVGVTDDAIEIVAFVPGIDPATLEVSIDKGLLTLSGERKSPLPQGDAEARVYARERYMGAFRRVVELPQQADPEQVDARYRDGCLSITVRKHEASKPRTVAIH